MPLGCIRCLCLHEMDTSAFLSLVFKPTNKSYNTIKCVQRNSFGAQERTKLARNCWCCCAGGLVFLIQNNMDFPHLKGLGGSCPVRFSRTSTVYFIVAASWSAFGFHCIRAKQIGTRKTRIENKRIGKRLEQLQQFMCVCMGSLFVCLCVFVYGS